jgi:hypothetical protein
MKNATRMLGTSIVVAMVMMIVPAAGAQDTATPAEQRILLSLQVSLADDLKPAARELLDALVANFRSAVVKACESELKRLDEQVHLAEREVEYADRQLLEIQQRLVKLFAQDSSSQTLRSQITATTSQLQGLQLERASQEAYRQAIVKCIKDIQAEVERTVHDDPIAAELNQMIQRRMAELKTAQGMVEAGRMTPTALADEEDKLAMARIDLARRREELAKSGSAAGLAQLTGDLTTLTLEAEKTQARERQLREQLGEMRNLLDRAGDFSVFKTPYLPLNLRAIAKIAQDERALARYQENTQGTGES